jgi:glyoxylase-like metal-dependent hydrolase (beta-lactamase superfamily II)
MIERGRSMIESVVTRVPAEMREEIEAVEIVPPDHVFAETATIRLGDRAVDLRFFGPAHTDSDIVVSVSDAAVSFAGDLIEECAPPVFRDAYPMNWPISLGKALEHMQAVVVPGHGDVVDRNFVKRQLAELQFIVDLARRVHTKEIALDDAVTMGPYPPTCIETALTRALAQLGDTRAS